MIDTQILITQPVTEQAAGELFAACRDLLGGSPDMLRRHGPSEVLPGNDVFEMAGDQGLPAWLMVSYGRGGRLLTRDTELDDPAAFAEVRLFSFGDDGRYAQHVHAWMIRETGRWLDSHGLAWIWGFEDCRWRTGLDGLRKVGKPDRGAPGRRRCRRWRRSR